MRHGLYLRVCGRIGLPKPYIRHKPFVTHLCFDDLLFRYTQNKQSAIIVASCATPHLTIRMITIGVLIYSEFSPKTLNTNWLGGRVQHTTAAHIMGRNKLVVEIIIWRSCRI